MGLQERRAREKGELKQEILDAASDLFVKEGYENVSMRKIAERIEYSPTTIYLYFHDKAELLDSICEQTFAKLIKKLQVLRSETDPVASLKKGLRAYIEFGIKHPNHYKLTFLTEYSLDQRKRYEDSRAHDMGHKAFENLCDSVAACVGAGELADQDVETTSQALWAAIHGLTALLITNKHFPWVERNRLIDRLIDTLVGGLRK